jgi:Tol biopolymer transport system component
MSTSSGRHFFISYSRTDTSQKQNIVKQLRARGINLWVDIENLVPGTPAWEREIERAIRGAAGIIVLLSPESNNSEWVRREISFAEQNDKHLFPVLIRGDEDDSIPLRLSNHQRVDLRRNYETGLDELADALMDHLGITAVDKEVKQETKEPFKLTPENLKKFALPGLIALIGLFCVGGLIIVGSFIRNTPSPQATQVVTPTSPDIDPALTATNADIVIDDSPSGKIVYTCQVNKLNSSDQICIMNADGTDQRQLTDSNDNQDASLAPNGETVIFVSNQTGNYEIVEMELSGKRTQLTDFKSTLGLPAISPDNQWIAFTNRVDGFDQIWVMERDGSNPRMIFSLAGIAAVAPTWSPDSDEILFAVGKDLARQLFIMGFDVREPRLLSDQIFTPGRTDWSVQGQIAYFIGETWKREIWTIYPDGTGMAQVTKGGNAQSPSFSPGGRYITYTAYTNVEGRDEFSCEIFIMDLYSRESRQLTDNEYCDYQPRWGN